MSKKNFYISDLHLNHANVIKFDKRPFENLSEMNTVIENNWNNIVTNEDFVYILGDIIWTKDEEVIGVLARLKGHKILIQGNHDHRILQDLRIRNQFEKIVPYEEVTDVVNGKRVDVILSHYPILMWNKQHKGSYHLYGHVHNSREHKYYVDALQALKTFIDLSNENIGRNENFNPIAINVGCMLLYMNYTPRPLQEVIPYANYTNDATIPKF